jgi:tetratricopeptide (TPR) repeat protein
MKPKFICRQFVWASVTVSLAACSIPQPYRAPARPGQPQTGSAIPALPPDEAAVPPPPPAEPPPPAKTREYTLGAASKSLVSQAESQSASGNYAVAAGTIERALRIEPDNPLLWIEIAKIHLAENNYLQAENLARKALSRATGDARTQASAWKIVADSYRGRGRVAEARDADERAATLSAR